MFWIVFIKIRVVRFVGRNLKSILVECLRVIYLKNIYLSLIVFNEIKYSSEK